MDIGTLFPSKYLKAEDLQGRTVTVTMQNVKIEKMGQGAEKEDKAVLYFQGKQKGLILNRTNAMVISAMYGSETNNWAGKKIALFPSQVRAFGKLQNVIRVRESVPGQAAAAPVMTDEEFDQDDEDFVGDEEPGDGDDLWATDTIVSPHAQAGCATNQVIVSPPEEELTPPRRKLVANGMLCFGDDWEMAQPWLIRRHQKQFVRDHVVDDMTLLSDDECEMVAEYLEQNMEAVRQTWPQQKKLMLDTKVAV